MKCLIKKVVVYIVFFSMLANSFVAFALKNESSSNSNDFFGNIEDKIRIEFDTLIDSAKFFGMIDTDEEEFCLGNPYFFCDFDLDDCGKILYYPVFGQNSKIVYTVIEAVVCNGTVNVNVIDNNVGVLNAIDAVNNEYIVYQIDGISYCETEYKCLNINEFYNPDLFDDFELEKPSFCNYSFEYKKNAVNDKMVDTFLREDSYKIAIPNMDEMVMKEGQVINPSHPMPQFSYNMCWAACVATIQNQSNLSVVTAFNVCNMMGIGYNVGGTIYDEQTALNYYGIYYSVTGNKITFNKVKQNINAGKMFIANCTGINFSGAHAVVIRGYYAYNGGQIINMWNPGLNSGNGGYQHMNYSDNLEYGTFTDGSSKFYAWTTTLAYYV